MRENNYIVLIASKEFRASLIELLQKHIGKEITYIDVYPEIEIKEDYKTCEEVEWIRGREV